MKKLLFFIIPALLVITSCTTTERVAPLSYYKYFDYTPLTDKGLFVMETETVDFEYKSLGRFEVAAVGGGEIRYYSTGLSDTKRLDSNFGSVNLEAILNKLAMEIKQVGADGIINFKLVELDQTAYSGSGFIVSGLAVKRASSIQQSQPTISDRPPSMPNVRR